MASVLGHGHAAPVSGAVKSVPSIRYTFSLVAEPNDCDRELVEVDALTPGAALTRSKKLTRRTGAFSTHSREELVATCVVVASTSGDIAVTVTFSCWLLILSWTATSV